MSDTQLSPSEPSTSKPESICMTFTPISFLQPDPFAAAKASPPFQVPELPTTFSCAEGTGVLSASPARKVALRCYKPFPSLLPRALFYSAKGHRFASTGVTSKCNSPAPWALLAQWQQQRLYSLNACPMLVLIPSLTSQSHGQSTSVMARRRVYHMCCAHHQGGALGTVLL